MRFSQGFRRKLVGALALALGAVTLLAAPAATATPSEITAATTATTVESVVEIGRPMRVVTGAVIDTNSSAFSVDAATGFDVATFWGGCSLFGPTPGGQFDSRFQASLNATRTVQLAKVGGQTFGDTAPVPANTPEGIHLFGVDPGQYRMFIRLGGDNGPILTKSALITVNCPGVTATGRIPRIL